MTASASARIAAVIARAIAPRVPLTVSQWADAERYVSAKGSAKPGKWSTDRNPVLREPMDCLSLRSAVHDVVCMFPIQLGKALALDTPIPTPHGWSTMGAIVPGDWVIGATGTPVRVSCVSPVFTDHPCYRLTFSDGEQVVADAGHRWAVIDTLRRNDARREIKRRSLRSGQVRPRHAVDGSSDAHVVVLTTEQIAATQRTRGKQSRYAVRLTAPLELPAAELPIDPYLLGVWLGDGGSAHGQLCLHEDDAAHIVQRIEAAGHHCRVTADDGQRSVTVLVDGARSGAAVTFHARLGSAGLRGNKHIPAPYLRASREQRQALLQGLLDTDGYAGRNAVVELCSSYPRLASGIVELIRTLGFKPSLSVRGTSALDSARVTFTAYAGSAVFSLPRKAAALPVTGPRAADVAGVRHIVSVESVPTVPVRCIAVESADHLFLCGAGFIPTHNTEIAINVLGYVMDHAPAPIMVALPGEVSLNKWVAQKLNPALDETAAMQRALTSVASRDAANQRTFKDFTGGQLYIEHGGSPQRLKSTTVKVLIVDELDEFAANLKGGDDPVKMLDGRTSAFPSTYKRLYISTPGVEGVSRIKQLYTASDQRRFYVPCPHCDHEQPLEWSGLHWNPDATACWYVCRECGACIDEHHKTEMIRAGRWVAENPGAPMRGYTLNALYYQFGLGPRWLTLVHEWRDAQGDAAKLKTFINDRLAETFEDPAMRAVKHNLIADRAEPLPLRPVPSWVLAVTVGIDTQDNRLAVQIVGWGRGLACWPIDYIELAGDPAEDDVWLKLVDLCNRPIDHPHGGVLRIEGGAIDCGGHRTEAVKAFVRQRLVRRLLPIFGAVPNNAPVLSKGKLQDVNWRGQYDKRGVMIHHVGTVGIKHLLYSRLSTDADKQPEARLVRFSQDLADGYFAGLVSETYNPAKNRFEKRRGGARNEPLDTWVYAYAATHHPELRLHRWTKADWDRREELLRADSDSRETSSQSSPAIVPQPAPVPGPARASVRPPNKSFRREW